MPLRATSSALVGDHDLVMLDLDGVVYRGPDAVPGAAEALRRVADRDVGLAYLTNNASRPAAVVAQHLRDLSMPLSDDGDVVTSAQAVATLMAQRLDAGSCVLVVGGAGLREALEEHGLVPVAGLDDDPAAVVQGFDPGIGWEQLAEASYAVAAGLPWYASNTDMTVPTARGIAPGNGSLVRAVRTATGQEPVVAGKPERPLFDETLGRTGATTPLMVGDRLDTDISGARAAGIVSLWVATGVHTLDDVVAATPGERPDLVGPDLSALLVEHAEVTLEDDRATCGEAVAELSDGTIRLTAGEPGGLEALRAVVALGWTVVDRGGPAPAVDDTMTT